MWENTEIPAWANWGNITSTTAVSVLLQCSVGQV